MRSEHSLEGDDGISPHMEYFAERVNLLFSYYFCFLEIHGDEDLQDDPSVNARTWMLQTMQTACLHTSLIALRDLDDFFTPRTPKSKKDDLKASDFGVNDSLKFLTGTERRSINKLIAHTTRLGASNQLYSWDILELIAKAISQVDQFLDIIKKEYGLLEHFNTYTAAIVLQKKTKSIFDYIKREISQLSVASELKAIDEA